jgi:cytochrome o ubiquinol oxidase subunit II
MDGVLAPAGPVGAAERIILLNSLAIMLAIAVPTIAATLAFAWWYRASNPRARRRPEFSYSGQLELLVWSVPALIVMFLGGIAWVSSHRLDPMKRLSSSRAPLEIQVVSLDWKWLFIYPGQHIASVNLLRIPVGVPIHFSLTSATVMNSFFVPQLGSQIYTMAGMATELNLQADRLGRFQGFSAQFSGDGFSDMRFQVESVSPAEFQSWADGSHHGPALDKVAFESLSKNPAPAPPEVYGSVSQALFDDIVRSRQSARAGQG